MIFSPLQIGMCERGWISDLTSASCVVVVKNRPRSSIIAHFGQKSKTFLGIGGDLAGLCDIIGVVF